MIPHLPADTPRDLMMSRSQDPKLSLDERLRILYPMVNEAETPLPRCWSTKDKYNYIGLSLNNLRVQYKGHGKTHKDASAVRATHPIPASCGVYYFEVRIVSKGRDGYMGVGLSAQGVNMNRLPGWDKHSYGYHGDDGHSFCSSGTGQAYGPTFTTGDVIGCGINLVTGSCFYTKNGTHLGEAFSDLPAQLYPTVGLQTPGEIVDANFGQEPFKFDIEGEMVEHRTKILRQVESFPEPGRHGDWQCLLHQMVSTYLVHHCFSSTAEAFNQSTGQKADEDLESVRSRQNIQRLVLSGRMGEAIRTTDKLYPELLPNKPELHFMLKVRQFIEMVSGCDAVENVKLEDLEEGNGESGAAGGGDGEGPRGDMDDSRDSDEMMTNGNSNAAAGNSHGGGDGTSPEENNSKVATNGNSISMEDDGSGDKGCSSSPHGDDDDNSMDVDDQPSDSGASNGQRVLPISANPARFDKLIKFGQTLQMQLTEMEQVKGIKNEPNAKMLADAFSLLAYSDPGTSPVGWQLELQERENVSARLNSAILESQGLQGNAPLEVALCHTKGLLKLMANNELGSCAFANVEDFLK